MSLERHKSAPDIKEIKEQEFQAQLDAQLNDFMTDIDTIITKKTGLSVMLNMERTRQLPGRIEMRFLQDAKAVTEEIKDMHRRNPELTHAHLLAEQLIKLNSIKKRVGVFMDIHTGENEEVSTESEAIQLAKALERISLESIDLLETLHNSGGREIKDEKTLEQVASHLISCTKPGADGLGYLVMAYLAPAQRMQVLMHMIDKPDQYPDMQGIVTSLVANNYLQVDQGQAIFDAALNPEKPTDKASRKAKRALKRQVDEFEEASVFLESKEMKQLQQRSLDLQKQSREMARTRNFGHKNYAREVFSLKGIVSAFAVANGTLTTVGNVIVNLDTGNMLNPYLYAGLGMVAGGLQLSNGFGGMAPTPLEGIGRITEEKGEKEDEKADARHEYMDRELGNRPKIAEFYYKNAEKIVHTYLEKKKSLPKDQIKITFADLGLVHGELEPNDLNDVPQAVIEKYTTKWVKIIRQNEYGEARKSAEQHQAFINESRKRRGLKEF